MGQANVGRTLDWLLAKPVIDNIPYQPKMLVFAGFAGALSDALKVGDIVIAKEVLDAHGNRWPTPNGGNGRLLTMDRLIATAQEKRLLGAQFDAQAVDMESALFAARSTQAGLPFACVRAISDAMATPLSPALATLLAGGTVSPWRFIALLARHPGMLPEMLRLARDTRNAAEQLGKALPELL